LEVGRFANVTVIDGNRELVLRTGAQTVGEALADAGITMYAADGVEPAMSSWIAPELVITVKRSMPLSIHADGRVIQTRSHHTSVLDVLAEAGIGLIGADYTRPGPDVVLSPEDTIVVVRVTEDFRVQDEAIPYETRWQGTDQLELDHVALLQAGVPGIQRQRVRVRYENGVEVSQRVDGEWLAQEPVPEIIGYGTKIVLRTILTENGPREYWRKVRMRVTSYTAATSGKAPDHPAYGITRSGLPAGKGIVAVDPTVVPWLSTVYVEGYGEGLAADTGGGVKGRWIDLGYPDVPDFPHWAGYTDVYYLTPVPSPDQINYLLPRNLP
jgi:3D (Asp-Asp-Asp) domain-containing protein